MRRERERERRGDFYEYLSNSDYQAAGKALSRRQLGISDFDNDSDVSHFFTSLMIDALRPLWGMLTGHPNLASVIRW